MSVDYGHFFKLSINMEIFAITVSVFVIAFFGMAIGVIIADKRIKGSCGGISTIMGKSACDICSFKDKCESSGKEICEEGEDCTTLSSDGPL